MPLFSYFLSITIGNYKNDGTVLSLKKQKTPQCIMMEFGGHLCYGPSNKENPRFLVQLDMYVLTEETQCGNFRNLLSFFDKNFVKVTFLLMKATKELVSRNIFPMRVKFLFFHTARGQAKEKHRELTKNCCLS